MPQFLYFIENAPAGNAELIRQCGLAHALDESPNWRGASTGPGDAGGQVASRSADGLGYFPDKQEWRSLGLRAGRRCWVGWLRGELPGPADLATPHALDGHPTRLWDDRDWVIPVAVQFDDGVASRAVPSALDVGEDGELRPGAVKPCYRRLWEIAQQFWEMMGTDGSVTLREFVDSAVQVLAVNYRVSLAEACALGLLDDRGDVARKILRACVDWPSFETWVAKKKEEQSVA